MVAGIADSTVTKLADRGGESNYPGAASVIV
jgi:hypothetical protein